MLAKGDGASTPVAAARSGWGVIALLRVVLRRPPHISLGIELEARSRKRLALENATIGNRAQKSHSFTVREQNEAIVPRLPSV